MGEYIKKEIENLNYKNNKLKEKIEKIKEKNNI